MSAQKVALINSTGQTVYDVFVSAHGAVVVSNRPDWTLSVPEMNEGDRVHVRYRRAMGAHEDPPRVRVRFRDSPDEDGLVQVEEFRLP